MNVYIFRINFLFKRRFKLKHLPQILLILIIILIFSCEDDVPEIGPVPTTFTKKVLIEEFTGTWCGYCPQGAYHLENIIKSNDGNVIGVSLHSDDKMSIDQTDYLGSLYQSFSFPSGMVDRYSNHSSVSIGMGSWESDALSQLTKVANCGLAIKSEVTGSLVNVEVHVGFNASLAGDYRLNVYLIEDNVTGEGSGYDQVNFYNSNPDSPFYGLGNSIEGYEHNNTLRAVLSSRSGDEINSMSILESGEDITSTYNIDISSYDKKNLSVVAFILRVGSDYKDHEVLNVQKCDINSLQDWD